MVLRLVKQLMSKSASLLGKLAHVCSSVLIHAHSGVAETVLTFPAYIKNAATKMLAKGAKVIVSAATPNNIWEDGSGSWGPDRFYYYDW